MSIQPGTLYVVATPIGNLGDLTERARQVLAEVDLVVAEDTRHSGRLLAHLGLRKPLKSLHEHNERGRVGELLERLEMGQSLALISDAGTPLVSDPGYLLVSAARTRNLPVSPVPGACAAIAALSVSGLPPARFAFEGFLPARSAARRARLEQLADDSRTLVFYESPRRVVATLEDLIITFGAQREAVLARELTKRFEQILAGSLTELRDQLRDAGEALRGEIVLLTAGAPEPSDERPDARARRLVAVLAEELPAGRAAAIAARATGYPRKLLYALAQAKHPREDPDSNA